LGGLKRVTQERVAFFVSSSASELRLECFCESEKHEAKHGIAVTRERARQPCIAHHL